MNGKLVIRLNVDVLLACLSSMAIYSRAYEFTSSGIIALSFGTAVGLAVHYAIKTVREMENDKKENKCAARLHRQSIYSRQGYRYSLYQNTQPETNTTHRKPMPKPLRILTGTPSLEVGDASGVTVHDILGI